MDQFRSICGRRRESKMEIPDGVPHSPKESAMKVKLSPRVLNYILLLACASPLWCQATTPQSSANQATHFLVTAPSSATGATAFQFTVKALNASNRVVTGYSG